MKLASPNTQAMIATLRIPMRMAPFTARACSAAMMKRPSMASAGVGAVSFPSATVVPALATITPASFRPMNAMKSPIPPLTAANSERGTALMMSCRTPASVRMRNATPEMKTQPSATCHGTPMVFTTVYVK